MKLFADFWKFTKIWKGLRRRTIELFLFWLLFWPYSLISIRQNYNFYKLAMIWHDIVCWFLKIYRDLKRFVTQEHRIIFVLILRSAEQFYVPNMQEQSKMGKNSEISRQTFVIWWFTSRRIDLSDVYLAVSKCNLMIEPP